jgi:hypothetical protein
VHNVYEMGLEDFIFGHPAQIALLGIQFQWTADTQAALVAAKSDKTILTKSMKKTDAILRSVASTNRTCSCSSLGVWAPCGPGHLAAGRQQRLRLAVLTKAG